jgi:hypothetical protein
MTDREKRLEHERERATGKDQPDKASHSRKFSPADAPFIRGALLDASGGFKPVDRP